jgi:hypothetical protein
MQEKHDVPIVQIEHPVGNFDMCKATFDSDPVHREESGVRRYRILRPIDDPNYVAVDLEFDDASRAEAFRAALESLWRSPQAAAVLAGGTPRSRIVDTVESREF